MVNFNFISRTLILNLFHKRPVDIMHNHIHTQYMFILKYTNLDVKLNTL
jgi:hypothetical protein